MKFNIYAGLGGSFGGAQYKGTGEFKDYVEAEHQAYEMAVEIYQSYEGGYGILDWNGVALENDLDPTDEENEDEIDELYQQEIEDWISYYAVLTEKDKKSKEELFEI